jgi:hypothetical protein
MMCYVEASAKVPWPMSRRSSAKTVGRDEEHHHLVDNNIIACTAVFILQVRVLATTCRKHEDERTLLRSLL